MKIIGFVFLLLAFFCKDGKIEESLNSNTSPNSKKIRKIIEEVETLCFRRTYVGHENSSEKELKKMYSSNPSLEIYDRNSEIVKKLNQLNLLNDTELVLSKFENKNLKKDYLDDDKKNEINCKYDSLSIAKIELSILNKTTKTIDFQGDHIIGILLRDIDDDDIKEVLFVTNYYIMNGDNFVLTILKYK